MAGLFFRHQLVVTPSATLVHYSTTFAAWLGIGISAFPEFTGFYNVLELNVVGELARVITEGRGDHFRKDGVRRRHVAILSD